MLRIGLVGVNAPVYYAQEEGVLQKSIQGLCALAKKLGNFELVAYPELICETQDAQKAMSHFTEKGIDFLMIQNSALSPGECLNVLADTNLPLGIWAVREPTQEGDIRLHSMVSMNLYTSILKQRGNVIYKWFYGNVENEMFQRSFGHTVRALCGKKELNDSKVALVGSVAPGFYNLEPDESFLQAQYGVQLVRIPFDEVEVRTRALSHQRIQETAENIFRGKLQSGVSHLDAENTVKAYCALRDLLDEWGIMAAAVSCWPEFQNKFQMVPCVAFTALGEQDGKFISCEGDVGAAMTMEVMHAFTDRMPVTLDFTALKEDHSAFLLWHCGVGSADMAPKGELRIIPQPMMGRKTNERMGMSYDYRFRHMPVTVARLSARNEHIFAFSGEMQDVPPAGYDGTRGWCGNLAMDDEPVQALDILQTIARNGIEHHLVVGGGKCEAAFSEFAYFCGGHKIMKTAFCEHL